MIILSITGIGIAIGLMLLPAQEHRHSGRRSIRVLMRKLGLRQLFSVNALHAYVYGRWTNQYIYVLIHWIFPRIDSERRKWWTDRYHGKVLTHDQAHAIITIDKRIPLRDLEQIIPYPKARDLVLNAPPDIVVFDCACRNARDNPCQPLQVCMVIGKPFTEFILKYKPGKSRRLSQAEALDLLRAEHERGHLHSAWFKDALMNRFYAICNCCKCCCGGVETMTKYHSPMMTSSGYVAEVNRELCTECAVCIPACPFGALIVNGSVAVDWEKCMGCGVCAGQCSLDAIALVRDERKGIPLDVRVLTQENKIL